MGDSFSIYLDQITQAVIDAKDGACFKAMEHVHQVAVSKTPVETGNMAGESYTETTPGGARVVYPGPYSRYQEFGVSHTSRGRPIVLPRHIHPARNPARARDPSHGTPRSDRVELVVRWRPVPATS
jgi:hypothetical protein